MNVDDINDGSGTPKIGFSGTLNQWIELKLNKDILHFSQNFAIFDDLLNFHSASGTLHIEKSPNMKNIMGKKRRKAC